MKLLYLLPVVSILQPAPKATLIPPGFAEPTVSSRSFFRIGEELLTLEKYGKGNDKNYILVTLHSGDAETVRNLSSFAEQAGPAYYRLKYRSGGTVETTLLDTKVCFDPNQIFTTWGRRNHLKRNNCLNRHAILRVEQLARFLKDELIRDKTVVSVDNNMQPLNVKEFAQGGLREKEVKELHINSERDPYDYLVTSDERIFGALKERGFNVVLVSRQRVKDNGSLGVYCAKANKSFVTVETGVGHGAEQLRMLQALDEILK